MGKGVVECGNDCTSNSAFCTGQRTGIRTSEIVNRSISEQATLIQKKPQIFTDADRSAQIIRDYPSASV